MIIHRPMLLCALIAAVLAAALALGCDASFSVSTAKLGDAKMATAVDPETKAPTKVVTEVGPNAGPLYATAKVSSAPSGTKVKAVFYYLEGERRQIAQNEITLKEGAYVSFQLSPPASGWPVGKYEVVFFLDGKKRQRLGFSVAAAHAAGPSAPVPAPAPAPSPSTQRQPAAGQAGPAVPPGYKVMTEANFGFSLQVPSDWKASLTPAKDYLISGPQGTPTGEVSLIIQIVDAARSGATLAGQMDMIAGQIARAPKGKVLKKGEVPVAGGQSPYFLASYQAKDTGGLVREFGHAQVGMSRGGRIFLVSYSAPADIYQANLAVFHRVLNSWRFTK